MKIYRLRPLFDEKDNFVFKQIVHKESESNWNCDARERIATGVTLDMVWNWGCKSKKLADLISSTAPGLLFTNRVVEAMGGYFSCATRFNVSVDGQLFFGVKCHRYSIADTGLDHAFMLEPQHYPLVTYAFKVAWDAHKFTGAAFEEISTMDDGLFVCTETFKAGHAGA